MSNNSPTAIARQYFDALGAGDMATVGDLLADEIVWHQPGSSHLSGLKRGKAELLPMLCAMAELSEGSFAIDQVDEIMGNGDLAAARIHFVARKGDPAMAMNGVDLLRVADGKIVEAWLFSGDQAAEDEFWDAARA